MPDSVQVSCINKRGSHHDPHERIENLGGMHNGKRWRMSEDAIIAELLKPQAQRRWNFYVTVGHRTTWVVVADVAQHLGRRYLKTEEDGYSPDNLLNLPECL